LNRNVTAWTREAEKWLEKTAWWWYL